jgi:gentisate 1,2-dioxygenase
MTVEDDRDPFARDRYLTGLADRRLGALWTYGRDLLPPEPTTAVVPHVWHYDEVRTTLLASGDVVTPDEVERRVLLFLNPGLAPNVGTTRTLLAAFQLLLPGETARAHRHSPAALRFIVEGSGAHTAVDGERTAMDPGDLVLTPSFAWHDHEAMGDEPVIWFDGLDLPLVTSLDAVFFQVHDEERQPLSEPVDASKSRYLHGTLRPSGARRGKPYSPVVNYPWESTERALTAAASMDDSADLITLEYLNPDDGGPVMPTIGAAIHRLAPGARVVLGRRTASSVLHVVRGRGTTRIGEAELSWSDHDVIAVPPWTSVEHRNASSTEAALLFSFTDEPVLRALHLYREG